MFNFIIIDSMINWTNVNHKFENGSGDEWFVLAPIGIYLRAANFVIDLISSKRGGLKCSHWKYRKSGSNEKFEIY